jgi:hypothetical protein
MWIENEMTQVRQSLDEAEGETLRWAARAEGLRAQLEALQRVEARSESRGRSGAARDLHAMSRTAAIEEVLRGSTSSLTIGEVLEELKAGGRDRDQYPVVAATLQQLLNQGRVNRPSRGRYGSK